MSNSAVEELIKPNTEEETEIATNEEVDTQVEQVSVENAEVINNEIQNEEKPKKSNKFIIVLIIIFIVSILGVSYYYINNMNNTKKDNNQETTTSDCDGDVCTLESSSSSKSTSTSVSTEREDQVLKDYLSKLKKSYNPFDEEELFGSKYYNIKLDEYTKCNGDNDVLFEYKNHKISYKCIPIDIGNDTIYVAKGTIDNVNVSTGDYRDSFITCGGYSFYGNDNSVIVYFVGNCDTYYPLGSIISFYSKDGTLNKEVNVLTFKLKYRYITYRVHPYIEDNYLYYIPSVGEYTDNVDTNLELHKLDLNTYEDTVVYSFSGKVIEG